MRLSAARALLSVLILVVLGESTSKRFLVFTKARRTATAPKAGLFSGSRGRLTLPKIRALCEARGDRRRSIVAENGKSITVLPYETVFHRSESVSETVNRYRFTV